jgi:hypothetical protein
MKTFAEVKNRLVKGAVLTMVRHDNYPNGVLIGVPREVAIRQSNAVMFEGGSWFYFPKASEIRVLGDNEFGVQLNPEHNPDALMVYQFN